MCYDAPYDEWRARPQRAPNDRERRSSWQKNARMSAAAAACPAAASAQRRARPPSHTNARSDIRHVIGVVSGKGGVGKSLVTSLLASQMHKRGFKVGILDADVTGPSIPKTFGITNPLTADADGILPAPRKAASR